MFSLVASCPVDVMPITRPLGRATSQQTPLPVWRVRMLHLRIAIALLNKFHGNKSFSLIEIEDPTAWIEELLSLIRLELFSQQ